MRAAADAERIRRLAAVLGRIAPSGTKLYLTGGATAVLEGWRRSTIDVHVRILCRRSSAASTSTSPTLRR